MKAMSSEELLALPAANSLQTAALALAISRTTAYDLARRGLFPVPLRKVGNQYRVTRSAILNYLEVVDRLPVPRSAGETAVSTRAKSADIEILR